MEENREIIERENEYKELFKKILTDSGYYSKVNGDAPNLDSRRDSFHYYSTFSPMEYMGGVISDMRIIGYVGCNYVDGIAEVQYPEESTPLHPHYVVFTLEGEHIGGVFRRRDLQGYDFSTPWSIVKPCNYTDNHVITNKITGTQELKEVNLEFLPDGLLPDFVRDYRDNTPTNNTGEGR